MRVPMDDSDKGLESKGIDNIVSQEIKPAPSLISCPCCMQRLPDTCSPELKLCGDNGNYSAICNYTDCTFTYSLRNLSEDMNQEEKVAAAIAELKHAQADGTLGKMVKEMDEESRVPC